MKRYESRRMKVGTGFKDEDLIRLAEAMQAHVCAGHRRPAHYLVDPVLEPDDWFDPAVVWECAAADLSRSSVHRGGLGRLEGADRGVGLRFPRSVVLMFAQGSIIVLISFCHIWLPSVK